MSRELPILFVTDMVRAIMAGSKTVTRMVVKPQPQADQIYPLGICTDGDRRDTGRFGFGTNSCGGNILFVRPPCSPGDLLYVRETWNISKAGTYLYKTDSMGNYANPYSKWHPSIHMPKEAARIWLKVTDVRVERLQEITEEQAKAEGVTYEQAGEAGYERWTPSFYDPDSGGEPWYVGAYAWIWNSTIKKSDLDRYGWDANPWVFVISFKKMIKDK